MNVSDASYTWDTLITPFGPFSVAASASGAIVATTFGDATALRRRLSRGSLAAQTERLEHVRRQLQDYFTGERREFDLPLAPAGTEFQRSVWARLGRIPYGRTRSYGELAAELGRPHAARAIGRANATNPICLFVPCHRVIGADGSLTGFAFGAQLKARLLAHEAAVISRRAA